MSATRNTYLESFGVEIEDNHEIWSKNGTKAYLLSDNKAERDEFIKSLGLKCPESSNEYSYVDHQAEKGQAGFMLVTIPDHKNAAVLLEFSKKDHSYGDIGSMILINGEDIFISDPYDFNDFIECLKGPMKIQSYIRVNRIPEGFIEFSELEKKSDFFTGYRWFEKTFFYSSF